MRGILLAIAMLLAASPVLAQDAGWIGLSIEDQKDRGAIIRRVQPNSPAEKAGLREGDVILEFNKEQVVGAQQLTRLVRETPVGRTVDVKIRRGDRDETVKVTTDRSDQWFDSFNFDFHPPDVRIQAGRAFPNGPRVIIGGTNSQAGIRVDDMTDQLRDYFGIFSNNGVLVTSVDSNSAAAKAGIKAGDVIVAVDGRNIRTPSEFSREMRADSRPMIKLFRDKQEREIRIE